MLSIVKFIYQNFIFFFKQIWFQGGSPPPCYIFFKNNFKTLEMGKLPHFLFLIFKIKSGFDYPGPPGNQATSVVISVEWEAA